MCTALGMEGKCKIHHDKPQMCQSVPFDPIWPEDEQYRLLKNISGIRKNCGGDNKTGELSWSNGRFIVETTYKKGFDERLRALKEDYSINEKIFETFILRDKPLGSPTLEDIQRDAGSGAWIETSTIPLLCTIYLAEQRTDDIKTRLLTFATNQINLLKTEIEQALIRKNRNERDTTNILRTHLKALTRFIESIDQLDK